jgi:hypothetical protein
LREKEEAVRKEALEDLERCFLRSVLIVELKLRYLLSQRLIDLFIAKNAIKSIDHQGEGSSKLAYLIV